jgi:hypothetical protein
MGGLTAMTISICVAVVTCDRDAQRHTFEMKQLEYEQKQLAQLK